MIFHLCRQTSCLLCWCIGISTSTTPNDWYWKWIPRYLSKHWIFYHHHYLWSTIEILKLLLKMDINYCILIENLCFKMDWICHIKSIARLRKVPWHHPIWSGSGQGVVTCQSGRGGQGSRKGWGGQDSQGQVVSKWQAVSEWLTKSVHRAAGQRKTGCHSWSNMIIIIIIIIARAGRRDQK